MVLDALNQLPSKKSSYDCLIPKKSEMSILSKRHSVYEYTCTFYLDKFTKQDKLFDTSYLNMSNTPYCNENKSSQKIFKLPHIYM